MRTGTIVALVAIPVVLAGGGVGAYFLIRSRRKAESPKQQAQDLAVANGILGPKAVAQGQVVPGPATPGGKSFSASSPGAAQLFPAAGKVVDMFYPGMGSKAASIAQAIDSKVGLGLIAKVPGLKKLKFW